MSAKSIQIESYYPGKLKTAMTAYNTELSAIATDRAKLSEDAELLKKNAAAGSLKKPERLQADVAVLQGRRTALDQRELLLIVSKSSFQQAVTEARTVERERVEKLAGEREAEINAGLDTMGADSRFRPGLVQGDSKLRALRETVHALHQGRNVVTVEDTERGTALSLRLAGTVPTVEV